VIAAGCARRDRLKSGNPTADHFAPACDPRIRIKQLNSTHTRVRNSLHNSGIARLLARS